MPSAACCLTQADARRSFIRSSGPVSLKRQPYILIGRFENPLFFVALLYISQKKLKPQLKTAIKSRRWRCKNAARMASFFVWQQQDSAQAH
jgi:hypothetical protein